MEKKQIKQPSYLSKVKTELASVLEEMEFTVHGEGEIGAEKLEGTYDVAIIRGVIAVLSPDQNQAAEDRGRFDLIMLQAFRESDIQYHQKRSQALDEDHWSATYRTIEFIVNTAGGRESWERQKNFVSNSFQDLVNEMHRNA